MYNTEEMSLFSAKAEKGLCSHAYIIDGESGIGKTDFALYCAKTLLCESRQKPCGYCPSCIKAASGNHPDIFVIGREKNATIADVRELIRRSSLKPNDGEKQVFIVCNGHKLQEGSQNALLKIFEEPPQSVAIFLLTASRSSLLPTVLSRGQRIHLDGMRDIEIAQRLSEKYGNGDMEEINNAIALSNGNYGVAERYLSKESRALRAKALDLLVSALKKENYNVSNTLLTPKYKREQAIALLEEFVALVNGIQKKKYGVRGIHAPNDGAIEKGSKKALALMCDSAFACIMALENNANVTAALSKFTIELLHAATK